MIKLHLNITNKTKFLIERIIPANQQKNCLKIIQGNARSIRHKMNELIKFYEGFDIVCISETWLSLNISICLHGFDVVREDRVGQGRDGVLDFYREPY